MSFPQRLWAMTIISYTAFTIWMFVHDHVFPSLGSGAHNAIVAASVWVVGLVGTLVINRFHHRAERLAEKAARDDTVIQLAGAVAHEMNQPLTIIISTAELLARRNSTPEDLRPYLIQMVQASERMADIVQKLERATSYRSKAYVGDVKIVDIDGSDES